MEQRQVIGMTRHPVGEVTPQPLQPRDLDACPAAFHWPVGPVPGLTANWTFVPSRTPVRLRLRRLASLWRLRAAPASLPIKPVRARDSWVGYFVYAPGGRLTAAHRFTLARLREGRAAVLVVCAAPTAAQVPGELADWADALYWKGLSGYDFSAYSVMLDALAAGSPGAHVCVMNDSVLGPMHPLDPFIDGTPWALTGFTASGSWENHLQSYAFVLRDVTPARIAALGNGFLHRHAFDRAHEVIRWQETRFGRIAASSMTVGACWYGDGVTVADPMLNRPFELLEAGCPYIKRSLLGKMSSFQDAEAVREVLHRHGHPLPARDGTE